MDSIDGLMLCVLTGLLTLVFSSLFFISDEEKRMYVACQQISSDSLFALMQDEYINQYPVMTELLNDCMAIRVDK